MNRRLLLVYGVFAFVLTGFLAGIWVYNQNAKPKLNLGGDDVAAADLPLERAHSPSFGPANAPVTLVEFFDPACATCRAFHPVVKEILSDFEGKVRVVMRYAAFHKGSDEVVKMLEAARLQGVFPAVLEAVLVDQPRWASHNEPNLANAWAAAKAAGLDVERARRDMNSAAINDVLRLDAADIRTIGVTKTPTFFVNGQPLLQFGMQQLYDMVQNAVRRAG